MPIDELAGGVLKAIIRFFVHLLLEVFWEVACHFVGFYSLRIITFGKYPPRQPSNYNDGLVTGFGLVVIVVLAFFVWGFF